MSASGNNSNGAQSIEQKVEWGVITLIDPFWSEEQRACEILEIKFKDLFLLFYYNTIFSVLKKCLS